MLVAIIIVTMVAATVWAAARLLAPHLAPEQLVFDQQPDRPHAFGYRMAWLAVRTRDSASVIDSLGLDDVRHANWRSGLGTVYSAEHGESRVFVSPPVNGWTFVVGLPLPHPVGKAFVDKSVPLLLNLGGRYVEVQYYCAYPAIDHFAWARVIDGKLVRAFAIGDEGVLLNKGRPTKEEKALGLQQFELRGVRGRKGDAGGELVLYPREEHVMLLAGKWSIDPSRLPGVGGEPGLGVIARAPLRWRAERIRQAA